MLRAGLYARVSTVDQQTLGMQNRAMREYAVRRGWTVAMQVREVNSGAARREARERLLGAARRQEIDLVPVWRLDGAGRSRIYCQRSRNWSISAGGCHGEWRAASLTSPPCPASRKTGRVPITRDVKRPSG